MRFPENNACNQYLTFYCDGVGAKRSGKKQPHTMKSQSMPSTIPTEYSSREILTLAYRLGWNTAHGIACHNVPTLGEEVRTDNLGRITIDADNIRDVHQEACFLAELNGRDFSPFEFIARDFNDLGEGSGDAPSAGEAWEAYDQGVCDSIMADLATYSDDDYGIQS
jgi:hypothetical protein